MDGYDMPALCFAAMSRCVQLELVMADSAARKRLYADLAALRVEIDRIDEEMHGLLIKRSEVIDQLVSVKQSQERGSAFRPGREASMMRSLAARHRGSLPLDTAEGIWRVIIGTFTYLQAPYQVHADLSGGDGPMRDSARFHFGFTVPFTPQSDANAVINAVGASQGDLGIVQIKQISHDAWWCGLVGPDKPKVIARMPFIERSDHPAGTPVFVISKPVDDISARDVILASCRLERSGPELLIVLGEIAGEVVARADSDDCENHLIALPGERGVAALRMALTRHQLKVIECEEVGSHAARFQFTHIPG
jgi:chorismate mutase